MPTVLFALLLAGCGGARVDPLTPRVYLDHALSVMRQRAVAGGEVNWQKVDAQALAMASGAKTTAQTYRAIKYAIAALQRAGDGHAMFVDPAEAKAGGVLAITRGAFHPLPTVSEKGRIGEVTLPNFEVFFASSSGRRYLTTALSGIASLERKRHPCGWIVNLDDDVGGNGWAMVLSVGPIIGDGRVFGFTGRKGFLGWASYRDGIIRGLGRSLRAPLRVPPITPAPPVAVLTSSDTASGGELAAIAFRGRPQTHSFGLATLGATNGPEIFRLADGAELFFGVNYLVDRRGRVYRRAIKPDVTTYLDQGAATRWLLQTAACRKRRA